ncbi:hypothetical protein ACSV5M_07355 [Cellvibrio sp. ARAG 10.3]|uniref:hypothetical protein n=1 Tax=Cellvibrio sp. ARAG 10.3 TaxID=3451358 RepID=UPI003F48C473
MSLAIHAYFLNGQKPTEEWAFNSITNLFSRSNGVKSNVSVNPFTKKKFLKLTIDESYSVSVFFDSGQNVTDDLKFIMGEEASCNSRIRILFGPDTENNFDEIKVIILDFLQDLEDVLIYNANQEKVISNSFGQ